MKGSDRAGEGSGPRLPWIVHLVLALSFVPTLHYNLVEGGLDPRHPSPAVPAWATLPAALVEAERALFGPVIEAGRAVGLGTRWRMFSPAWRFTFWWEWSALHPDGRWVEIPWADMSAAYRARRGWGDALLFDFKRGIEQFSLHHQPRFRRASALHVARAVEATLGWRPRAMRGARLQVRIPEPGAARGWDPYAAEPWRWEYPIEEVPPR